MVGFGMMKRRDALRRAQKQKRRSSGEQLLGKRRAGNSFKILWRLFLGGQGVFLVWRLACLDGAEQTQ